MARQNSSTVTDTLTWAGMAGVVIAAIALARLDRRTGSSTPTATVRSPASSLHAPSPTEMREAAADLEKAAARAQRASSDLEKIRRELDDKRAALESVNADADANAERTKRELEDARGQLESRQSQLERASREAEERVRAASQELERLRHQQLSMGPATSRDRAALLTPRTPPPSPVDSGLANGFPMPPSLSGSPPALPPQYGGTTSARAGRSVVNMDQASRFAASAAPRRLSSEEFDRATGEINWPSLFMDANFGNLTRAIEGPFRERAARGGDFDVKEQMRLKAAIDALAARLRSDMAKYSAGRYGAAQTFLDSLRAESGP